MTFLLGATVVASWVGVRGTGIIDGPGPWLHETWFAVWAIQALLASGLLVAVEWLAPSATGRAMVAMVLLAWFGELLVAAIVLPALTNDLDVIHGPFVWVVATGFGVQPAAAILGGALARRRTHADAPVR
jgi:hypothetical protein